MTLTCRLLIDPAPNGGGWNMAADDILLDAGVFALRFYSWAEPTLSLGYFQPHLAGSAFPELAWLRRATGGEAIVHHHELTYSLVLPGGGEYPSPPASWMRRFHGLIRDALRRFGVAADPCEREQRLGNMLCFLHHTPGDLIASGHKVVGSAQRKQRGGMLQHGSILLRQSLHTPALPGIAELTGRIVPPEELRDALIGEFRRETGWTLGISEIGDAEREQIEGRIASRYASSAWNEKR